jgi:hypothetical protein
VWKEAEDGREERGSRKRKDKSDTLSYIGGSRGCNEVVNHIAVVLMVVLMEVKVKRRQEGKSGGCLRRVDDSLQLREHSALQEMGASDGDTRMWRKRRRTKEIWNYGKRGNTYRRRERKEGGRGQTEGQKKIVTTHDRSSPHFNHYTVTF